MFKIICLPNYDSVYVLQHSFFCRLTEDKKSEKFFKVFYDRMKVAQQEIKATVTVNTSDLGNKKKDDDSDRDVPARKRGNSFSSVSVVYNILKAKTSFCD